MENYDIHALPYFSEGFLSTYRNLFTYQWRHLGAFGKKIGIHIFSLGQKRFFLHQADFLLDPLSHHPRWLHNLSTEGLAVSFTSFCGFQGQHERERGFFPPEYCTLQLFYEYVKMFLKQELYSYFLLLLWMQKKMARAYASSQHFHFMLAVFSACTTSSRKHILQWIVKLCPDKWKAQHCDCQRNILLDCTHHSLQSSIIACWAFPILSTGKHELTSIESGIFVTQTQPSPVYL